MKTPSQPCSGLEPRLAWLLEANHTLATAISLETLIPDLIRLAREATQAEAASFQVYDPSCDCLTFYSVNDEVIGASASKALKDTVRLKVGEGIAGWIVRHRRPIRIDDVQQNPRFCRSADDATGFHTRTLLGVPVMNAGEVLGVIEVLNAKEKARFSVRDEALLTSFADLAAVAVIRARLMEQQLAQQKLELQMETAARIQRLFRPRAPSVYGDSYFWGHSRPAQYVGGDLYDWIPMPDGSWLVYVADVSDKGLPAALIMTALWMQIRSEALQHDSVSGLLCRVNTLLFERFSAEGYFATLLIGRYYPTSGRLSLASAGHPPPLWISSGGLLPLPPLKGIALGAIPVCNYSEIGIQVALDQSLLMITDGATDARNPDGRFLGEPGLQRFLARQSAPPWGPPLVKQIENWCGTQPPFDDLTLLEIFRTSTPPP